VNNAWIAAPGITRCRCQTHPLVQHPQPSRHRRRQHLWRRPEEWPAAERPASRCVPRASVRRGSRRRCRRRLTLHGSSTETDVKMAGLHRCLHLVLHGPSSSRICMAEMYGPLCDELRVVTTQQADAWGSFHAATHTDKGGGVSREGAAAVVHLATRQAVGHLTSSNSRGVYKGLLWGCTPPWQQMELRAASQSGQLRRAVCDGPRPSRPRGFAAATRVQRDCCHTCRSSFGGRGFWLAPPGAPPTAPRRLARAGRRTGSPSTTSGLLACWGRNTGVRLSAV
jgi:hypothetical protein